MKKSLVALTIATASIASVNATTVYNQNGTKIDIGGSLRVMGTWQTGQRPDLQNDSSRLKFGVSQEILQGLNALGYVEIRFDKDESTFNGLYIKNAYAGLNYDKVGQITFGRQAVATDDFKLADPTEQALAIDGALNLPYTVDKAIQFKSASWEGFSFEASYIFDASSPNRDTINNNGYQALLKYDNQFGIVGVQGRALYSRNKGSEIQKDPISGLDVETGATFSNQIWGVGAGITIQKFGFAVDFAQEKIIGNAGLALDAQSGKEFTDGDKVNGVEAALTFQATDKWDIYGVFHHYGYHHRDGNVSLNGWVVGTHYYLNKYVMTYVEYDTDKLTGRDEFGNKHHRDHRGYVGFRVFF